MLLYADILILWFFKYVYIVNDRVYYSIGSYLALYFFFL